MYEEQQKSMRKVKNRWKKWTQISHKKLKNMMWNQETQWEMKKKNIISACFRVNFFIV